MNPRFSALFAIVALLIASAPNALAGKKPDPAAVALDAVVIRPICCVVTVVSSAVFVVALPFAAMARRVPETAETMVARPARAMFCRPLGDFKKMRHENVGHDTEQRNGQPRR